MVLILLIKTVLAQAADNMKAFPPAREGMVRYVLQLPEQANESAFRVELIVGKTVWIDRDNRYFFAGKIEAETIAGWFQEGRAGAEFLALPPTAVVEAFRREGQLIFAGKTTPEKALEAVEAVAEAERTRGR